MEWKCVMHKLGGNDGISGKLEYPTANVEVLEVEG